MTINNKRTVLTLLTSTLAGGAVAAALVGVSLTEGSPPVDVTRAVAADARPAAGAAPAPTPAEEGTTPRDAEPISPQMQLDDTDGQRAARIGQWQDCLVEHGATYLTDSGSSSGTPQPAPGPGSTGTPPKVIADPVPPSASRACRPVLPRLPKETNPDLNPDYVADSEANVRCLRDHGILVHLYRDTSVWNDALGWTYDSADGSDLPEDQGAIEKACRIAAFS